MSSINIFGSVKLHKDDEGRFSYTDTYGERHEFDSAAATWEHLIEDGQEFPDEVKQFIFGTISKPEDGRKSVVFGSWEVTTDHAASNHGQPVLVNRATFEAYGPGDIVQIFPSWGLMPAGVAAKRLQKTNPTVEDPHMLVEKFVKIWNMVQGE